MLKLPPLEGSPTVAFHDAATALQTQGVHVYDLTAGEPKVASPIQVRNAVRERLAQESVHYPPVPGLMTLRKAATNWLNQRHNCRWQPSACLVTHGGKFGLYLLLQALVRPGDEVLLPRPSWPTYGALTSAFGGTPRWLETTPNENFKLRPEQLRAAITPQSRVLLLNSAGNPTGSIYTRKELASLLDIAEKHGLFVISDEVYSELVYEGDFVSCGAFKTHNERIFVIQSCSKSFAMTGWRVGFVWGRKDVISHLTKAQGQSITSATMPGQWAALAAFAHADAITTTVRNEMRRRRDLFVETFRRLFDPDFATPSSALYAFAPLTTMGFSKAEARSSYTTCLRLLKEAHVATIPGSAFGQEGYVRCSFSGTDEDIIQGLQRIHAYNKR